MIDHDKSEAPELTDDFFDRADLYDGDRMIRKGKQEMGNSDHQKQHDEAMIKVAWRLGWVIAITSAVSFAIGMYAGRYYWVFG